MVLISELVILYCLQPIKKLISSQFPDIKQLTTSTLHKGIAGSRHQFLSLPPGKDKLDLLSEVGGWVGGQLGVAGPEKGL